MDSKLKPTTVLNSEQGIFGDLSTFKKTLSILVFVQGLQRMSNLRFNFLSVQAWNTFTWSLWVQFLRKIFCNFVFDFKRFHSRKNVEQNHEEETPDVFISVDGHDDEDIELGDDTSLCTSKLFLALFK